MTIILLLIGAALIYLIQARLYSHYWRQGLHVAIHFPRQAVVEGENATLVEEITNNKRLPLPILHVKFKISRNLLFEGGENTSVSDSSYRHDIFSVQTGILYHRSGQPGLCQSVFIRKSGG